MAMGLPGPVTRIAEIVGDAAASLPTRPSASRVLQEQPYVWIDLQYAGYDLEVGPKMKSPRRLSAMCNH